MTTSFIPGDGYTFFSLADLACSAAEQLDQLSRGASSDPKPIKELAEYLKGIIEQTGSPDSKAVGAMRLTLVRHAMISSQNGSTELNTIDEVVQKAAELAASLETNSDTPNEILKKRDFCLTLSKVASVESRLGTESFPGIRYKQ